MRVLLWMAAIFFVYALPAQSGKASPQAILDFLSKPIPAGSKLGTLAGYPSRYADWTESQRKSGLLSVMQYCGLVNALAHDDPSARLVPEPMTKTEEAQLAVSVCIPPKMPADWPERGKFIGTAQTLITKAATYGVILHLPEGVAR